MAEYKPLWRKAGITAVLALALTGASVLPATAGGGTMTCTSSQGGGTSYITNGNSGSNSWAQTTNYSGWCETVSHSAYVNQYGSWVTVARGGYSSAHALISRNFYGTMAWSRHYHNGNANTKLTNN